MAAAPTVARRLNMELSSAVMARESSLLRLLAAVAYGDISWEIADTFPTLILFVESCLVVYKVCAMDL